MIVDSGLLKVTHSIKAREPKATKAPFIILYSETDNTVFIVWVVLGFGGGGVRGVRCRKILFIFC